MNDRYNEEQARFNHFENKCSKLLTFLTGLIGALSIYGSYAKKEIFSFSNPIEVIIFVLFIFSVFCIICAWGHALLAIKIGDCPILPKNRVAINYIRDADKDTSNEYVFNCYIDTLEALASVIDEKSQNLVHSYNELTLGAWAIGILALITIIMEIVK
ncbi:hypothetical protein VXS03_13990 [Photobacterium sp. S4TG1]|uniref:hypothetical protein n=1 Tax=Photobacterium sp. S4TG1 TaxID=3114587 RepID=UPI002E19BACC|nr:hypothetical protein [Photobacterium sp. S4TG1]